MKTSTPRLITLLLIQMCCFSVFTCASYADNKFKTNIEISPYGKQFEKEFDQYTIYIVVKDGEFNAEHTSDGRIICGIINPTDILEITWNKKNKSNYSFWPPYADPINFKHQPYIFKFTTFDDIQGTIRNDIAHLLEKHQYEKAKRYLGSWVTILTNSSPPDTTKEYDRFIFSILRDAGNISLDLAKRTNRSKIKDGLIEFGSFSRILCMQYFYSILNDKDRLESTDKHALFKSISIELNNWLGFCRTCYRSGQSSIPDKSMSSSGGEWFYNNDENYKTAFMNELTQALQIIRTPFYRKLSVEYINKSDITLIFKNTSINQQVENIFESSPENVNINTLGLFIMTVTQLQ